MNYFGMSENHIRYKISFQNLLMLFQSIPKPSTTKESEKKEEKKISSIESLVNSSAFKVQNK